MTVVFPSRDSEPALIDPSAIVAVPSVIVPPVMIPEASILLRPLNEPPVNVAVPSVRLPPVMIPVALILLAPFNSPPVMLADPSVNVLADRESLTLTSVKFPSTGVNDPITVLLIEPPDIVRLSST